MKPFPAHFLNFQYSSQTQMKNINPWILRENAIKYYQVFYNLFFIFLCKYEKQQDFSINSQNYNQKYAGNVAPSKTLPQKFKTLPCTGAGNKEKYLPLSISKNIDLRKVSATSSGQKC